jgi:hypothetical protein
MNGDEDVEPSEEELDSSADFDKIDKEISELAETAAGPVRSPTKLMIVMLLGGLLMLALFFTIGYYTGYNNSWIHAQKDCYNLLKQSNCFEVNGHLLKEFNATQINITPQI